MEFNSENWHLNVPDLIEVDLNVTKITIKDIHIDESVKQVQLLDNEILFKTKNFTADLDAHYEFITDPPILADIGEFRFLIENLTMAIQAKSGFSSDGFFAVDIQQLDVACTPVNITFDGISDISNVLTRLINFSLGILQDRLLSIIKFVGPTRIGANLNKILEQIPDEIDIPFTDFYVEGGLSENLKIVKD
jgi:hypothetical protein